MGSVESENRPKIVIAMKHSVVIIGRFTAPAYKLIVVLYYEEINESS